MTFRASVGLGFMCLALAGCSDEESSSPPAASAPRQAASDVSTHVATAEWRAVIDDWYVDGTLDSPHRCAAIRKAIEQLPSSPPHHSSVYEDMRRYERRACG